jgi:hypothetical protein
MLNEESNVLAVQISIAVATVLFLVVMWGGLWYFIKFKGKDLAYRGKVINYFEEKASEESPSEETKES